MNEVTKMDMVKVVTKDVKISRKLKESRLHWYGNIMKRDEDCVGRSKVNTVYDR